MDYKTAARKVHVGYSVTSGYEEMTKVAPNTWKFTGEDHIESIHDDIEAAEMLEDYFPGSPAGMVDES